MMRVGAGGGVAAGLLRPCACLGLAFLVGCVVAVPALADGEGARSGGEGSWVGASVVTSGAVEQLGIVPPHCQPRVYWMCSRHFSAFTTERRIVGETRFECGIDTGICGDMAHSVPFSWVDIVGGISDSCEDHSTSFYGPDGGEWNGCLLTPLANEVSLGEREIEGVNQTWDRWPPAFHGGEYASIDHLDGHVDTMRSPFATVYDLDYCVFKQLIGTIHWPDLEVRCDLVSSDPYGTLFQYSLTGSADRVYCSDEVSSPEYSCSLPSPGRICSDLIIEGTLTCHQEIEEPDPEVCP